MDIICKPKYNAIFWRNSSDEKWKQGDLTEILERHDEEPITILNLWETVRKEGTDEFLYNVWECAACGELVLTVDEEHGYSYCPHCGTMIVDSYF